MLHVHGELGSRFLSVSVEMEQVTPQMGTVVATGTQVQLLYFGLELLDVGALLGQSPYHRLLVFLHLGVPSLTCEPSI